MYDLRKIIILGSWGIDDRESLTTVVMQTNGLKIENILYLCDKGTIGNDKKLIKSEIQSELYDDMYDDDLKIKVKEVLCGEHAIELIAKFIDKIWTNDTLLYYYEANNKVYNKLEKELRNRNVEIYLSDYYDIFIDGSVNDGDISDYLSTETIRQKIRDNYLRDTSVTIVLIGPETWKRKYVDWEISSSIRNTEYNPRSGFIGILLPNHRDSGRGKSAWTGYRNPGTSGSAAQ